MMYVLLVNLYLVVFYAVYVAFFSRETFFRWNRYYLVAGMFLAFAMPLVTVPGWDFVQVGYPSYFLVEGDEVTVSGTAAGYPAAADLKSTLRDVYIGGCVLASLVFVAGLLRTFHLMRRSRPGVGFSFFGKVQVDDASDGYETISRHEQVHADEWHSLDVLIVQAVKIFGWFNPVVYGYERALRLQHEYLADEKTAKDDQVAYAELLVARAMGVERAILVHSFSNQRQLKSRITMLLRSKSPQRRLLRYAWVLPLVVAMAVFSMACNQEQDMRPQPTELSEPDDLLFESVEVNPEPPDGMKAFMEYIGRNYDYPQEAIEEEVTGKLSVSFVVEKDGSLTDVKLVEDLGYGTGEAAIRVVQSGQKWSPGMQNGRPVRVAYTLPIRLNLIRQ